MKYYITLVFLTPFLFLTCKSIPRSLPHLEEEPSIRMLVKQNYPDGQVYVGATTDYDFLSTLRREMIKEFSYITPANAFKQTRVHPTPGEWNWTQADAWLRFLTKNDQVVRLHAPISPQCSKWMKEDNRKGYEMADMLEEYMTAICRRYNGHSQVKWLDVVNETIAPDGTWFGPKPGTNMWENPWTKIGFDTTHALRPPIYIKKAFEIANQYAPDIKLIINQHGQFEDEVWDRKMKDLVLYLRDNGYRVDGVGWQAHVTTGWELEDNHLQKLADWIDWAHANDLEFHVTENTVWRMEEHNNEQQSATFSAILSTLLSKRSTGMVTYNLWQLVDQDTQRKFHGNIYDENFIPKPAYFAIKKILQNPPK